MLWFECCDGWISVLCYGSSVVMGGFLFCVMVRVLWWVDFCFVLWFECCDGWVSVLCYG